MEKRTTILLVDDCVPLLVSVGDYLRVEGFSVATAAATAQAESWLRSNRPDIVVLDLSMPGTGGLHLLHKIRSNAHTAEVPVIIYTCRTELHDFCDDVHVNGFVSKSEPAERLVAEIQRVLSYHSRSGDAHVDPSRISLLLGEDDEPFANRLRAALETPRCHVEVVRSGAEVIERAIVIKPHAVLVASALNKVPTDTVVSILARTPGTGAIPLLLYTRDKGDPTQRGHSLAAEFPSVRFFPAAEPQQLQQAVRDVLAPPGGGLSMRDNPSVCNRGQTR